MAGWLAGMTLNMAPYQLRSDIKKRTDFCTVEKGLCRTLGLCIVIYYLWLEILGLVSAQVVSLNIGLFPNCFWQKS